MKYFLIFWFLITLCKASDTLSVLKSFNSPISNPRAIEFDGKHFWISSINKNTIYQLDTNIKIIDSIPIDFDRITGITFQEDAMWVINDKPAGMSSNNPLYRMYNIAPCDGSTIDSVEIISSAANPPDTNHLWGLTSLNNIFYVSYNGGSGPCVYQIAPKNSNSIDYLCCAHSAGMTAINNTIYAVGNNPQKGNGNHISYLKFKGSSITEIVEYSLEFSASDIAYDGRNIWLCNSLDSKILKMEKAALGTHRYHFIQKEISAEHNPSNSSVTFNFGTGNVNFLKILNISGSILHHAGNIKTGNYVWNYERSVSNGIYVLNFTIKGIDYSNKIMLQK